MITNLRITAFCVALLAHSFAQEKPAHIQLFVLAGDECVLENAPVTTQDKLPEGLQNADVRTGQHAWVLKTESSKPVNQFHFAIHENIELNEQFVSKISPYDRHGNYYFHAISMVGTSGVLCLSLRQ